MEPLTVFFIFVASYLLVGAILAVVLTFFEPSDAPVEQKLTIGDVMTLILFWPFLLI